MKCLSSYFLKLVWSCLASAPQAKQVAFKWTREGEGVPLRIDRRRGV